MNRDTCKHYTPGDLLCEKCEMEAMHRELASLRAEKERAEAERDAALKDAWKPIPDEVCIRIVSEWYDADESGVELIRRVEAYQNAQR